MARSLQWWRCVVVFPVLFSLLAACNSQPVPTLSPTMASASTVDDVLDQYEKEIRPLAEGIEKAQAAPAGLSLPSASEREISPVPLDERLYVAQMVLYPRLNSNRPSGAVKLYLGYAYERGRALGGEVLSFEEYAHTQEVVAKARLVAEMDGVFYLIEEERGVGGAGAQSTEEAVRQAVEQLELVGTNREQVENALRNVLGYVTGLDWNEPLEIDQRVSLLQGALTSSYWADRKQASETLGRIGPEAQDALPSLTRALLDREPRVRIAAAGSLGQIGPTEKVIPILIETMGDDNREVGLAATEALARIGLEAIPALIKALGHTSLAESAAIREGAVDALRLIGPGTDEVIPALIEALRDDCSYVRRAARYALETITGKDLGQDYNRWRQYWSEQEQGQTRAAAEH